MDKLCEPDKSKILVLLITSINASVEYKQLATI